MLGTRGVVGWAFGLVVLAISLLSAEAAQAVERELVADIFRPDGTVVQHRWSVSQEGNRAVFRIPAEEIGAGSTAVVFRASFATARKGEDGYFVLCDGLLGTFREERGFMDMDRSSHYMPFY